MSDYLLSRGTRQTPQTEQTDPRQVANDAGGFVYDIGDWAQLRRWLILGSEGGDFYASESGRTIENVRTLQTCTADSGERVVAMILEVSHGGLAPSNEQALYALAYVLSNGDRPGRRAAAEALPDVARTGTHLFHFVKYAETMRGWGRTLRWAIANWYTAKEPQDLAYQAVKYRQRDGVTHRDLLRLSHPTGDRETAAIFDWITHGASGQDVPLSESLRIVQGHEAAMHATSARETAALIREYRLPREAVNPDHLSDPETWRALLDTDMPIMALTRNLGNMTRVGVLDSAVYFDMVLNKLTNVSAIRKSRLHPIALLVALRTYASGHGLRGDNLWHPKPGVTDALDEAFYLAFDNAVPTGKRILLGIDVSGSMSSRIGMLPLSAREAAVAMALVTLHVEPHVEVIGYTSKAYSLSLSRRQRLDDALASVPHTGEGTDCSIPYTYALVKPGDVYDAVVQYTDNQTWAGPTHVAQEERALRARHPELRSVACGMVASRFSVLDDNPWSLNVVGFDVSTPTLISAFVAGQL